MRDEQPSGKSARKGSGRVPPSLQHSITPPLPFSEIFCNLAPRFPLYQVEARSLPAKTAQRKKQSALKTGNTHMEMNKTEPSVANM